MHLRVLNAEKSSVQVEARRHRSTYYTKQTKLLRSILDKFDHLKMP